MQHRFGFLTSFTILSVSPVLCLSVMRDCLFSPWSEMPIVSLAAFSCRFQIRPANTVSLAELKRNRWPLANCKRTIGCHESRIAQPWLESMSFNHDLSAKQSHPSARLPNHEWLMRKAVQLKCKNEFRSIRWVTGAKAYADNRTANGLRF